MQFLCPFVCISCTRHAESAVCSRAKSYLYIYTRSHPTDKNKPTFVYWEYFYLCIYRSSSVFVSPLCGHEILDSLQLCSPIVYYTIDFDCGFKKGQRASQIIVIKPLRSQITFWARALSRCWVLINTIQSSAANILPSKWVCAEGHEWNCVAHWLERDVCFDEFSKRQNPKCIHAAVLTVCWVDSCIICTTATLRVTRDSAQQITPKGWILHWNTHRQGRARSISWTLRAYA